MVFFLLYQPPPVVASLCVIRHVRYFNVIVFLQCAIKVAAT
jgi:hypothetical protein